MWFGLIIFYHSTSMGQLDKFEPIIGELKAEGLGSSSIPLLPYMMYVDAPESSRLRILVTDFTYNTWMAVKSTIQLENMRNDIGIGRPWSEFVEYLIASIKSGDTKIVFEGQLIADGPAQAKLVAQKCKGMPLVCFHLDKLAGDAAIEASGYASQELFKRYKSQHELQVKEGQYHLAEVEAAEQEKSEIPQSNLDQIQSSKRLKLLRMNEKAASDSISESSFHESQAVGKEDVSKGSAKVINRVVPAYRRAKVQGVFLPDIDDDSDE